MGAVVMLLAAALLWFLIVTFTKDIGWSGWEMLVLIFISEIGASFVIVLLPELGKGATILTGVVTMYAVLFIGLTSYFGFAKTLTAKIISVHLLMLGVFSGLLGLFLHWAKT